MVLQARIQLSNVYPLSQLNACHFFSVDKVVELQAKHEEDLERECLPEDMGHVAKFISWEVVGLHLPGISTDEMQDIKMNEFILHKEEMLLKRWRERNGADATYLVLIIAMLKAKKRKEADLVCKLLSKKCKYYF